MNYYDCIFLFNYIFKKDMGLEFCYHDDVGDQILVLILVAD